MRFFRHRCRKEEVNEKLKEKSYGFDSITLSVSAFGKLTDEISRLEALAKDEMNVLIANNADAVNINDSEIHVTKADKDSWGNNKVVGAYFGTGESTQTIKLGFKPSFVFVCVAFRPMISTDEEGNSFCYAGVATETYSSMGLSLTSNGFKVTQNSSTTYNNTTSKLNQLMMDYAYIAFK